MSAGLNPNMAPSIALGDGVRTQATWSPYGNEGGTAVAVAGADYCIVAATTRMSSSYGVMTRKGSNIIKISNKCVVVATGFQADIKTVQKELYARHVMYQHQHHKPMPCAAMAQLIGNTLYYRRFFPYYSSTICAGLDEKGVGAVYGYDVVGSHQRLGYTTSGTGESLIQPVLDNQLAAASPLVLPPRDWVSNLPLDDALDLIKDAFVTAGERDVFTGDMVEILVMTKDGVKTETMELKKD